jgi:hypothetical protein
MESLSVLYLYLIYLKKISVKVKPKVKFALQQAMKAQRGSRGIALLFL